VEVNIILDLNEGRKLEDRIFVSQNTKIRFIARVWNRFLEKNRVFQDLSFTLYFDNRPPDGFQKRSTAILQNNFFDRHGNGRNRNVEGYSDIVIAEGIAAERGEFKYGIKADNGKEELFDEDPYLIIR
jgi:hypothetical protein